jgi:hypothetical protein
MKIWKDLLRVKEALGTVRGARDSLDILSTWAGLPVHAMIVPIRTACKLAGMYR